MKNKVIKVKTKTKLIPFQEQDLLLRNPKFLKQFLEQPRLKIAEAITGALSAGTSGLVTAGGRLIQGAIKGNLYIQFGREINKLIEDGKIKEDYPNKKYGFQSLADFLNFIDSEAPDEDRFKAAKAMFFALNSIDVEDSGEEMLRYQLFKITLELTSSQLLMLKISYDKAIRREANGSTAASWVITMGEDLGHKIDSLVIIDENILMEKHLISPRRHPDKSGITQENCRLTKLGMSLCKNLSKYS